MEVAGSKDALFFRVLIGSDHSVIWALVTTMRQVSDSGYKLVSADAAH